MFRITSDPSSGSDDLYFDWNYLWCFTNIYHVPGRCLAAYTYEFFHSCTYLICVLPEVVNIYLQIYVPWSRDSDLLGAGQSGDRIPVGRGEILRNCPDLLWSPLSLLYNWHRASPGGKVAGAWRWPPTLSSAEVKV